MPLDHGKAFLVMALAFLCATAWSQGRYPLRFVLTGKDTSIDTRAIGLTDRFAKKEECQAWLAKLVPTLQSKGYVTASLDSLQLDSLSGTAWLFLGANYRWVKVREPAGEGKLLQETGWNPKAWTGKPVDMPKVAAWQERALTYLENHGYPFAKVQLDSLRLDSVGISAVLAVDKGPLYKVDSLRNVGKARISNYFLQKYLGIENGSLYRRDKLDLVSRRILELPYVRETQPWDMTMLGTGSTLNLYLDPKKSSQINALVGFLPASEGNGGKLLLTGEANVNLKNALGGGEVIGVNWQQLQLKSPRLDLAFSQPYMFHSPFGLDFHFNLYKRDSTFLNINFQLGLQYLVSSRQSGHIFYQLFHTSLLTVDTNYIKATRQLPPYLDLGSSNLGIDYQYNSTDYRFNPRKGDELAVVLTGGLRTIRKNSNITSLTTDATGKPYDFNALYDTVKLKSYLIRLRLNAAHHFQLTRQSTLRTALQGGWLQTQQSFSNEAFQIGGYRLLRGFDEESIYATGFAVGTAEYRYLIGLNSYMFAFTDYGWAKNASFAAGGSHTYLGLGMGIAFETKAGIINLSYAVGKRNDLPFSLRQSKIHIGFVSLF
jgi:outer membrane protein assembly factor BamA